MGNSSSGHQQVTLVDGPGPPNSWAHSFPRTSSFKVLPDRVPNRKLRHTNNGAILHNGGTISGRKVYAVESRDKRHQQQQQQDERSDYRKAMYGSEPDLRYDNRKYHHQQHRGSNGLGPSSMNSNGQCCYSSSNDSSAKARIGRTRKKYKAPPVPTANNNHLGSSSPDSYQHWETSGDSSETNAAAVNSSSAIGAAAMPARRSRLFKTRAETKRPSVENNVAMSASEQIPTQLPAAVGYKGGMPGHLQRSLSSPQFQDELTAKLRQRGVREPPVGRAADSPHSSPTLKCKENIQYAKRTALKSNYETDKPVSSSSNRVICNGRLPPKAGALNGKLNQQQNEDYHHKRRPSNNRPVRDSSNMNGLNKVGNSNKAQHRPTKLTDRLDPADRAKSAKANQPKHESKERASAPVKTFYFGMEEEVSSKPKQKTEQVIDKFTANFRKSNLSSTSPSDSYSSGPATTDETSHGISLKLRPTLPRKQFDIPRFSPTAAWRLLSALESPVHSEEDDLVLIEEQIPHPNAAHQLYDKSGDSGISGDASPHREDSGHNSQVAWTPQQDLEETSSDGGLEMAPVSPESVSTAKFSPRFSLSLPREEHLTVYSYSDKMPSAPSTSFQNLKKLKRSVSGALGKNKDVAVSSLDENWLLSRSVPNLYNSYRNRWSDTSPSFADQDDEALMSSLTKPASFSYLASGGHVMYLPEYQSSKYQQSRERHKSSGNNRCRPSPISKSCEDLSSNHRKSLKNSNDVTGASNSKQPKKFTFQSTIRQIERKRIAEKLSKDAEQKERQRLRELEAMRKVEEEFQRKREREKADIRQQLRLYNLSESVGNNNRREQPDGMVYPTPPAGTQILSEYREPRREYKDFTTAARADSDSVSHTDVSAKKETVHPEVVYHMPKSAHVYVTPKLHSSNNAAIGNGGIESVSSTPRSSSSDNYRKNFAQGILPRSLASSDSELSQSNIKPTTAKLGRKKNSFNDFENDDSENNDGQANANQIFNSIGAVKYLSSTYKRDDNGLYSLQLFENANNDEKEVSDCAIVPQYQPSTLPFVTKAKSIQYLQPFTREDKQYKPIHFKQILTS